MTEYIYFVKCPCCDDEPFDFFDDAKGFAMSCLSKKPIITQTEVNRNDFGECTDHCDLGTVWSWEETMRDIPTEPELKTFKKSETLDCDDDYFNCEFDDDFSSLDSVPDNYERPVDQTTITESSEGYGALFFEADEKVSKDEVAAAVAAGKEVIINVGSDLAPDPHELPFRYGGVYSDSEIRLYGNQVVGYTAELWHTSDDGDTTEGNYYKEFKTFDAMWETVAADFISDRVVESVDRKPLPTDMTIESLIEEMEENEDMVECKVCEELAEKTRCHKDPKRGWVCENCRTSFEVSESVSSALSEPTEVLQEYDDPVATSKMTMCPECGIEEAYDHVGGFCTSCGWSTTNSDDKSVHLTEASKYRNSIELHYDSLTTEITTRVIPAYGLNPPDYEEGEYTDEYDFEVETNSVEEALWDEFLTNEDVADVPGGMEALEDAATWKAFMDAHFEELVEKYYDKLLEYFREEAEEEAREVFQRRYYDDCEYSAYDD
jgi:hypothetical protein